jgi:hypothetical protein
MANITPDSTIRLVYEVIVSMTTFNIFARIRCLPCFFRVWTLEIVPTLDNLVCEVIDYKGLAMKTCSHANRKVVFQFYNINNKAYFSDLASTHPLGHWIQFQTGNYQKRHTEFYSAQFKLFGYR